MRYAKIEGGYFLRLEVGEKLPGAIERFCREKGIAAASAEGIGALREITLGYFDPEVRSYERFRLEGSWELLHLFADVAEWQEAPFAHTHVVLSGRGGETRGGHLFEATVSVTAEIRLWTIASALRRRMDEDVGLPLLDLPEGA